MKTWISRGTAVLFGLPFMAGAQTPAQPTDEEISEEIVVTAQKRASSIQEVPFSVAAVTAQDIKESGATNIVEVARNVPGLYVTDLGPGQSQVAIRGISAGQVVRDQAGVKESVGIYLDESPISVALFTPDLDLYDLDRIEVLRGPQGTLFGAGSSSGTVRYITAQPTLEKFGGSVEVGVDGLTDGDWGGSLRGALNAPLGGNAAMRVVGYYNDLPGFIDSVYPNRATREDVNSGTRTGGRVTFRFEPNENFNITPRLIYQKLETDGYPRIDAYNMLGNPYTTTEPAITVGERDQVTQFREGLTDEFFMGDLKLEFGFGGDIGLTSVTTYIDRQVEVVRDASQLTGSVSVDFAVATPAEVRLDSPLIDSTDLQVFSQELRLASTGEGPFQWLVGAFYQQADREYGQDLPTPGYDAILLRRTPPGRDSAYLQRPARHAVLFRSQLRFQPVRTVRRGYLPLHSGVGADCGPALLRLQRRPHADLRRGLCRPGLHRRAGLNRFGRFLAARHPCFQPRRRRADQCAGVAWLPTRRYQRSAQRRDCAPPTTSSCTAAIPPGMTRRRLTTRSAPRLAWPTAGSPSTPRCS